MLEILIFMVGSLLSKIRFKAFLDRVLQKMESGWRVAYYENWLKHRSRTPTINCL